MSSAILDGVKKKDLFSMALLRLFLVALSSSDDSSSSSGSSDIRLGRYELVVCDLWCSEFDLLSGVSKKFAGLLKEEISSSS
jgi:hypothetical protein